jgi:hypothetical protein
LVEPGAQAVAEQSAGLARTAACAEKDLGQLVAKPRVARDQPLRRVCRDR